MNAVKAELEEAHGVSVTYIALGLSERGAAQTLYDKVQTLGLLPGSINCAEHPLSFQAAKEAFHNTIVPTITLSAHTTFQLIVME